LQEHFSKCGAKVRLFFLISKLLLRFFEENITNRPQSIRSR